MRACFLWHIFEHILEIMHLYINILCIQFLISVYSIEDYYDYHYL